MKTFEVRFGVVRNEKCQFILRFRGEIKAVYLICVVILYGIIFPHFSKYTEERFTRDLQVPYYVKTDFLTNYRSKIAQIEHQVEDEYVSHLRMKCYRERNESKFGVNFSYNR